MKLNWKYTSFYSRVYFISVALYIVAALLMLCLQSKVNNFIWLNSFHNKSLDHLFMGFTFLGDGVFSILVSLYLVLRRKYDLALCIFISYLGSGIVVQVLKQLFSMPRPQVLISSSQYFYFIPNVTLSGNTSFPSGHTCSVFSLATIFSLHSSPKQAVIQSLLIVLALLTAYSRMYLGQHFLMDILVGSVIGIITGFYIYANYFNKIRLKLAEKRVKNFALNKN